MSLPPPSRIPARRPTSEAPDQRPASEWWRGASIYQIYPRSFQDTNGDGVGDLPGITRHLPYVADLGVDAIWISPFFTSPMKDFGYDVSNYRDVDPTFGTLGDFDHLVAEAHRLGLKVLIDQVLSHSSDQHAWFKESRTSRTNAKADWYVWAEARPDGTPPNNWQSVFGGSAWSWEPRRRQYYLHNFLESQPDLNFHHEPVQDQLLEEVRFWMERGVDGFRFDACNFHFHDKLLRNNPSAKPGQVELTSVREGNPYGLQIHRYDKSRPENLGFLKRLRSLIDEYGAMSVGEVGDEGALATMAEYTADGDKLHMAYGFSLFTEEFTAARIRGVVQEYEKRIRRGGGWGCWSLSNHDCVRVVTRWGKGVDDPALAKLLLAMLGSLRGSFCIYQGEELGLPEAEVPFDRLIDPYGRAFWPDYKGRDGCRTPMPWTDEAPRGGFSEVEPWLPMSPDHLRRSVVRQSADPASVLRFYRQFLAWRKGSEALCRGSIRFDVTPEPLLLLRRQAGSERVLAAFNLSAEPLRHTLSAQVRPLDGHGLDAGRLDGRDLFLPPWGGFFGHLA
ncbi:putative alpha-glucosidase [Geothrix limicola]|uniref:Alpha-glucosidase n=1 Tax=Geothrix limicola TaxID=2927978 RepID=A0ABQ5QF62_9BACT|nr:alpha-glucosidase [Geothrix limicola]GLH73277.1 putative alpha-glucosidase [Geothrix limicola]